MSGNNSMCTKQKAPAVDSLVSKVIWREVEQLTALLVALLLRVDVLIAYRTLRNHISRMNQMATYESSF